MARNRRLSPNKLAQEKGYFANLKAIAGYTPLRAEFKVAEIQPIADECDSLRVLEAQKQAELDEIKDRIAASDTALMAKLDGAAGQVGAQFGEDSAEYASLGRKRKSERRTGGRRSTGGNPSSS